MLRVLNHELGADFDPRRLRAPGVLRVRGAPDRDAPRRRRAHQTGHDSGHRRRCGSRRASRSEPRSAASTTARAWRSSSRPRASHRGLAHRPGIAVRARGRGAGVNPALPGRARGRSRVERPSRRPPDASLTPRRIGAEVELIPVDAATGRRCPLELGEGATPTLPFLRRYGARQGWRESHDRQGHAVLPPARRWNAHLRARRPAGVQLPGLPLAERPAGPAALGRAAAPRGGRQRRHRPPGRRHRPMQLGRSGPLLLAHNRYTPDGRLPRPDRARGRADDAPDRGLSGESRSR